MDSNAVSQSNDRTPRRSQAVVYDDGTNTFFWYVPTTKGTIRHAPTFVNRLEELAMLVHGVNITTLEVTHCLCMHV